MSSGRQPASAAVGSTVGDRDGRPSLRPAGAGRRPPARSSGCRSSHLRKVIAGAMRASKQTAAHVTHVDEADVTDLVDHYRAGQAGGRGAVRQSSSSLLPFFIKALVTALKRHPMFNASVDEDAQEILLKRYYNIGIAVDTPEGLIVPVVRDADTKDMVTLAAEVADLAERARARQPEPRRAQRAAPARSPTSARSAGSSPPRSSTSRSSPSSACTRSWSDLPSSTARSSIRKHDVPQRVVRPPIHRRRQRRPDS